MCSSHWCCRSMVNQKLFFWSWRKDSHLKAVLAPFLEPETVWPEGRLWKTFGRYHKFKICTQSSSTAISTTQNGPCFRTTPPSSRSLIWLDKKRWANNLEKHMRSIHFWVSLAHFLAFLCNVRKVHSASIKHWHSSYHNLQGLQPDGSLVIRPIPFKLRRISFRICKVLQRTRYISFSVSKPALASDELPCHEIFCIYKKNSPSHSNVRFTRGSGLHKDKKDMFSKKCRNFCHLGASFTHSKRLTVQTWHFPKISEMVSQTPSKLFVPFVICASYSYMETPDELVDYTRYKHWDLSEFRDNSFQIMSFWTLISNGVCEPDLGPEEHVLLRKRSS